MPSTFAPSALAMVTPSLLRTMVTSAPVVSPSTGVTILAAAVGAAAAAGGGGGAFVVSAAGALLSQPATSARIVAAIERFIGCPYSVGECVRSAASTKLRHTGIGRTRP